VSVEQNEREEPVSEASIWDRIGSTALRSLGRYTG
jgi:hypothetical protein